MQTVLILAATIALCYGQTFLITAAVEYLERPKMERQVDNAYRIIAATGPVYICLAVRLKL
jgi:hypothetical protein